MIRNMIYVKILKLLSIVSIGKYHHSKDYNNVSELLNEMKVGTDLNKEVPKAPPMDYKFEAFCNLSKPFRDMKIENPSTKALT